MISFEMPAEIKDRVKFLQGVVRDMVRPQARYYDDHEHEIPWDFVNYMWELSLRTGQSHRSPVSPTGKGTGLASLMLVHTVEILSWGDAGIYLCLPGAGLGGAAIEATGTKEQKERFLARYWKGKPTWACMAMTEAHCGSDTAAIRTTAITGCSTERRSS
jgi:acyl-CoA dehydrogenase